MSSTPFLSQVSCSSPGNCAIAGNYQNSHGQASPLLGTERAGAWGQADPIGRGAAAAVLAISCPRAAGDCAAGGLGRAGAFLVSEKGGVWEPPRLVADSQGPVTAMSCSAAGSCLAGRIDDGMGVRIQQDTAFIVSEQNGRWGPARPVPGLSRLARRGTQVDSVSCVAGGDCAASGSYVDQKGRRQVFVADEHSGVWGRAQPVPGLAALSLGGRAGVTQVSCGSAGLCAAGGWYLNLKGRSRQQAWVARQTRGRWGRAEKVPGTAALNTGGNAEVTAVSCAASSCVAGGWYRAGSAVSSQAFLVSERRGAWHGVTQLPGVAALNTGDDAAVTSVSCAPSGWWTAVGDYTDAKTTETRMFVVSGR
jgi:hypothetical protein